MVRSDQTDFLQEEALVGGSSGLDEAPRIAVLQPSAVKL